MANNKKVAPKGSARVNDKDQKKYKNPAMTVWGKTIIAVLALLMLFSGLAGLIVLIILNA